MLPMYNKREPPHKGLCSGSLSVLVHLFQSLLFFLAKCLRYVNTDVYNHVAIASAISLNCRQTFVSESQSLSGLSSRLDLYSYAASVNCRNFNTSTKSCGREVKKKVIYNVVVVTDKRVVRLFFYIYLYVSWCSVVSSCIAFSWYIYYHTFRDTGRNVDFNNFFTLYNTSSAASVALVLYNCTFTATCRTYALSLHHAEQALSGACHHAAAMTCRTGFSCASVFSTCSVAVVTCNVTLYFEFLCNAC